MANDENLEVLNNDEDPFYDYFADMDLNSDIKKIYDVINDDELQEQFINDTKLTELRNDNHKRYFAINIKKIENLPTEFSDIVYDVIKLYNFIDSKLLLTESLNEAENSKQLLDNIYRKLDRIDKMVSTALKTLEKENDEKQSQFSISYFKNLEVSDQVKKVLIDKYNDLVLFNGVIGEDSYDNLKRQMLRKEYIYDILNYLHLEKRNQKNIDEKDKLSILNQKIEDQIKEYKEKIQYLEDLMSTNSKHIEEFTDFKNFLNRLFAYDDTNYDNAKQTYEVLSDKYRFSELFGNFEDIFIQDREYLDKEKQFIYNKLGIKNVKMTLNYIYENYYQKELTDEEKKIIDGLINDISSLNYDLEVIEKELSIIVSNIWKNTITDIYSYNPNDNFYFICSNSEFMSEKQQAILISKKELEVVNDYSNYEIGFICGYNDNILNITENEDSSGINHNDMSYLKTPIQIEKEFIYLKICNRIILNGYKTKKLAVYCIKNNSDEYDLNYNKALELANTYNLPLIELKKSN